LRTGTTYTKELHEILSPHVDLLGRLLTDCQQVHKMTSFPEDYHTVPSFSYLWTTLHRIYDPLPANMDQKKALAIRTSRALEKRSAQSGSFQYFGDLSAVQRAQISQWIFDHVPGSQASPQFLMDRLPTVHAATIVIAHLCRERLPNVEEKLHLHQENRIYIIEEKNWRIILHYHELAQINANYMNLHFLLNQKGPHKF